MGIITAKGKAAKESANKKNSQIDFKKVYIRLKDGDSVRVRLLTPEDYVEYRAHGLYSQGIFTQPCIHPAGQKCAHCEAGHSGVEEYQGLRARKRYLFAMADIDDGSIRVFDASKGQAQGVIETIEQYTEDLRDLAFVFKRTGTKVDTNFTLNPIIKMKPEDREKFNKFDGATVEDSFYETVLQPRSRQQQIEELQKAGFPVEKFFAKELPDADVKPIDDNEPENVF
ncbi:hypothetical protein H1S01_19810 [Heliobacterium chlorum]|uniref:Bacteriophage T4 Gp32 single-stranded DNA-binding domain-containing protein n=1 Tax=Heliobacterium chlorum TaxID=2698 RepID=A0ABR7T7T5_HELCL|nr:hypothetical protein [Heliobacterium chlorum]MBC9786691.1 hypothetical protein [Heliobacterium chlorum]